MRSTDAGAATGGTLPAQKQGSRMVMTPLPEGTSKSRAEMLADTENPRPSSGQSGVGIAVVPQEEVGQNLVDVDIPVDRVDVSPYQPRLQIDEDELLKLAESIEASGLWNPITVRSIDGRFQLVAGERRWRAHLLLGRLLIRARIKILTEAEAEIEALGDNEAREDLSDFERALRYQGMLERGVAKGKSALARLIGKDRHFVLGCLAMLQLPEQVVAMLRDHPGFLSSRAARDFVVFVEKDSDLVIDACTKVYHGDLDATNALNWLKAHSKARHFPATPKVATAWEVNGRRLGAIKAEGRKLVISCGDGVTPEELLAIILAGHPKS